MNEARFGFNRINITFTPIVPDNPSSYGINNGITGEVVLPQITVQGVGLNFGGPNGFPQGRTDTTFVLSDTLSYLRGRHAFKFGGEYRRFNNVNFGTTGGTFTFPAWPTSRRAGAAPSPSIWAASTATSPSRPSACSSRTTSRSAPTSPWSWASATT